MAKNEVKIVITGDASKLQAASKQADGALAKLGKQGKVQSGILDGAFGLVKKSAVVAGGAVAAVATKALWGGFSRLKGLEEASKRLDSMGITAGQSEKLMAALNDTLTGTPYALDAGAKAMAGFVSSSTPLAKIPGIMNSVTDAAAFGQAPLEEVANIFQKVQTNGKASATMLQQLQLRGIPASELLASALGKTGDEFQKFVKDGGLTSEVFFDAWEKGAQGFGESNIQMAGAAQGAGDTMSGAWGNLITSLSRVGAKVLEPLYGRLKGWFQDASKAISDFTKSGKIEEWMSRVADGGKRVINIIQRIRDWFKEHSTTAKAAAVALAVLAAGFTGLLATYKVVQQVQSAVKAFKALRLVLTTHPIILIVAAVAALAVGLVWAYRNVGWFHDAVDAVGRFLKRTFQPILEKIVGFLKDTWPKVVKTATEIWTGTLWPALQAVGGWISGTLWPILQKIGEFIAAYVVTQVKAWAFVFTQVLWPALQAVGGWISGTLWPILKSFGGWIADVARPVITELGRTWTDVLWPALKRVGGFLSGTVWPALKAVADVVAKVLTVAVKASAWTWSNVLWPALKVVVSFLSGTVWPAIQRVASIFVTVGATVGRVVGQIVGFIIGIPRRIAGTVSTLWTGITNGINAAKNTVSTVVTAIVNVVTGIGRRIGSVASAISSPFRTAFNNIKSLWNSTVGKVDFQIPSWVPGVGGKGFKIPKMHTGGVVPGPRGAEVLTILEAGELVIPAELTSGLRTATGNDSFTAAYQPAGGGSTVVVKIDLSGALMTPDIPGKIVELFEQGVAAGHQTPRLARSLA